MPVDMACQGADVRPPKNLPPARDLVPGLASEPAPNWHRAGTELAKTQALPKAADWGKALTCIWPTRFYVGAKP